MNWGNSCCGIEFMELYRHEFRNLVEFIGFANLLVWADSKGLKDRKLVFAMNKRTKAVDEETYKRIVSVLKEGFTHAGVDYKPNERIATVLILEYNLGLRVGDVLNLTIDSFAKDGSRYRLDIYEQKTGKYRNFNQLHEQLCIAYPSYKMFFNDISRPTALYFWSKYPSQKYLKGIGVEDLREELVPISHNRCSTRTCEKIIDAIKSDKVKENEHQDARDVVTKGIVSDLQHYEKQLQEVDTELEKLYYSLGFTITTIPGVNITTAVKMLAEIGDINRFSNASKLAQFAGIAPIHLSSAGKGIDKASKQGNRRLQATFYFLSVQMIQLSVKGTPRNPAFRAYYERRIAEGKNGQQVLICISRRLVNIVYGMLKSGTKYRMPEMKASNADIDKSN